MEKWRNLSVGHTLTIIIFIINYVHIAHASSLRFSACPRGARVIQSVSKLTGLFKKKKRFHSASIKRAAVMHSSLTNILMRKLFIHGT